MNVTSTQWVAGYLEQVDQIVEQYGGKYLARTSAIDQIEGCGPPPQTLVILEFPSQEAAYGFYHSPEYTLLREARKAGSIGKFYFVAGEDAAGSK